MYSRVWTGIKDTRPEHVQEFARNVEGRGRCWHGSAEGGMHAMQAIDGTVGDDAFHLGCHRIRGRSWDERSHYDNRHVFRQQPWKGSLT
jgi:hypothetical protein